MTALRLALLTVLLAGCGQKGPLYFDVPESASAETQDASADLEREQERQPANND